MIELHMNYDKSRAVIERLGIGTVLNSFNFIAEEIMELNATIATRQVAIYQIDKDTFFKVIQNDKKLLKTLLKLMMEDFN